MYYFKGRNLLLPAGEEINYYKAPAA